MTRDEAINIFRNKVDKQLKWNDFTQDFELLLHEIFDCIDNRLCNNCKYWNENEECKLLVYDDDRCMITSPSFSCNQWGSKDNAVEKFSIMVHKGVDDERD
jgi:hypothetical protein